MKGLISKILIVIVIIVIAFNNPLVAVQENWAQWYDWNGMSSVVGMIRNGSITPQEACDIIIIPASNAGFVEEKHAVAFTELYPEMKDYLITLQHLQQSRLLPYLHTLSRIVIC